MYQFQPTRPLRGATLILHNWVKCSNISTHAPLAGRDRGNHYKLAAYLIFQPTRPLRGATFMRAVLFEGRLNFNPRAPCGARRVVCSVTLPSE